MIVDFDATEDALALDVGVAAATRKVDRPGVGLDGDPLPFEGSGASEKDPIVAAALPEALVLRAQRPSEAVACPSHRHPILRPWGAPG